MMLRLFIIASLIFISEHSLVGQSPNEDILKELDLYIEKKDEFDSKKLQRIKELHIRLNESETSGDNPYSFYADLYQEYIRFQYDSAFFYSTQINQIAEKEEDPFLINDSKLFQFECFASTGLYKEAIEVLNSIDTSKISTKKKIKQYFLFSDLYFNMALYVAVEPLFSQYMQQYYNYNRKIIGIATDDNPRKWFAYAQIYNHNNDFKKAMESIDKSIALTDIEDSRELAMSYIHKGVFYIAQNDTAEAIHYFCLSAIEDIKASNKETASIRMLSELLYAQGDIDRAYSYANNALDDANYYNARQRKIEAGRIMTIVDAGRYNIVDKQKDQLFFISIVSTGLFILLLGLTIVIFMQIKRLKDARIIILEQNKSIKETNDNLVILNTTKDRFFSIIAHDLKNPFNSILGFSEILANEKNLNKAEIEDYAKMILHSSQLVYNLLENLLLWARSQTDHIAMNPKELNLKGLIDENMAVLRDLIQKKEIVIKNNIPEEFKVIADNNMIGTVIRNLLTNSLKFTYNQGEIEINSRIDDEKTEISIKDSGIGMGDEELKKLFKTEVNNSTTGTDGELGTGLGLLICKEYIEKHHGEIWAESKKGKGSIFRFTLPLTPISR